MSPADVATHPAETAPRLVSRLVGVGLLLCLLATAVGMRNVLGGRDGGFVVLTYVPRPRFWCAAGLGLLAVGLLRSGRGRWRSARVGTAALAASVALLIAALSLLSAWWRDASGEDTLYPSPDGRATLLIHETQDILDPMYRVQIRHGSGLTERWWGAGCVNGDIDSIEAATWTSPTTVEVTTSRDRPGATGDMPVHVIDIDPANGRPQSPVPAGLRSC